MGTPDFAAASLDALLKNGYNIAGVFTQPDKAKGRGMEISFSPVKELALENEIPVFQPAKMRDGSRENSTVSGLLILLSGLFTEITQ